MELFPRSFGAEEAYKIRKPDKFRQKLPVAPGQAGQVTSKTYLFLCFSRFSLSLNIVFT
jgi:hypothetical protein